MMQQDGQPQTIIWGGVMTYTLNTPAMLAVL